MRSSQDKSLIIHLHESVLIKLRKLMRKSGNTELKPFIEEKIMQVVIAAEKEGII